jgi:tetratricopeptide (TPR) repeat protein
MQRLNVKLIVWLAVGSFVLLVGVVLVHRYQISDQAETYYLKSAQEWHEEFKAEEEKTEESYEKLQKAIAFYRFYLSQHSEDRETSADYALAMASYAGRPNRDARDFTDAAAALEMVVRIYPEHKKVRRKLIDFSILQGRISDAREHITELKEMLAEDGERDYVLEYQMMRCELALAENDLARDRMLAVIEEAPQEVEAYALLSGVLEKRYEDEEGARKYIDLMVENNPEDHNAYLARAHYFQRKNDFEAARADVNEALELRPDHLEALLLAGRFALDPSVNDKDLAREYLLKARELHPESARAYLILGHVERTSGDLEAAAKYLNEGIEKAGKDSELVLTLVELNLDRGQAAAAKKLLDEYETGGGDRVMVDYLRADTDRREEKWVEAAQQLEQVRTKIGASPRYSRLAIKVNLALADCYRRIGQQDLQARCYERVLAIEPGNYLALSGQADSWLMQNMWRQAYQRYVQIEKAFTLAPVALGPKKVVALTQIEVAKPEEDRNWDQVNTLLSAIQENLPDDPARRLDFEKMEARLLIQQHRLEEAREKFDKLLAENPDSIQIALDEIPLIQLETDPETALKAVDKIEERFEMQESIPLARIRLIAAMPANQAKVRLLEVEKDLEKLPPTADRVSVLRTLATAYTGAKDIESSKRLFRRTAEALPQDLPVRVAWFYLCKETGDMAGMSEALDSIKDLSGENSAFWQFGEATRLIMLVRAKQGEGDELKAARRNIMRAKKVRPEWPALVALEGEAEELLGNLDQAISLYQVSLDLGSQDPQLQRRLLAHYLKRRQIENADQLIESLPEERRTSPGFREFTAELLKLKGNTAEAVKLLEESYDPESENVIDHLRMAESLLSAERILEAEKPIARALEVANDSAAVWVALVKLNVVAGKIDEAQAAMQKMQLHVPEEQLSLAMAECSEAMKDLKKAETYYRAAVQEKPEDLARQKALVTFYFRTNQYRLAEPELNRMIRSATANPKSDATILHWSREKMAVIVASGGRAADYEKALALLRANTVDGERTIQSLELEAQLLSRRPDMESRRGAVSILEGILERAPSRHDIEFFMAQLLERNREWERSKEHMQVVCFQQKENQAYLRNFIGLLLKHGEVKEAASYYELLRPLIKSPPSATDLVLEARIIVSKGEIDKAITMLNGLVPRPLPADRVAALGQVGALFEQLANEIDDPDDAERLLAEARARCEEFAQQSNERGALALMAFESRQSPLVMVLEAGKNAIQDNPALTVAGIAVDAARRRPEEITPEFTAAIEGWIEQAKADETQSARPELLLADLLDLQGDYDGASSIYRDLLKRESLIPLERAGCLNNLAYIMVMKDSNWEEAQPMVAEAIDLLGPRAQLLDTRAMVELARGEVDSAIDDLRESIADTPSGIKYFHLALAYHRQGDIPSAMNAMDSAREEGFTVDEVPALEREAYTTLQTQLEQQAALPAADP